MTNDIIRCISIGIQKILLEYKYNHDLLLLKSTLYGFNTIIRKYKDGTATARVVPERCCCAHVASVIWYLGYYRHQDTHPKRKCMKFGNYLCDAAVASTTALDKPNSSIS